MLLYNEKAMRCLEKLVKLPLLALVVYGSYQYFPFLFYTLGGASSIKAGWLAWLLCACTIVSAHFLADAWCAYIHHALPRIGARMALLLLAVPMGVLVSVFWLPILIALVALCAVLDVMNIIK